jgi:two-component sensor histidine kinase
MRPGDPTETHGSDRQAARERAFRTGAGAVAYLFAAFAILGGVFLWYDHAAGWVAHTHQVRSRIADVMQSLTDAESAQRGYVLTGDRHFLGEVEVARAKAQAQASLQLVDRLTNDNPDQQARVATLSAQMAKRLAIIDQTRVARQHGDAVAAIRIIRRGEGTAAMLQVRREIAALDQAERALEASRKARAGSVRTTVILSLVLFAGLLTLLFIHAMRDLNLDREAEADVAERLRGLLADRTLLLDEANHRVKNSLQQIASVVRLQSRNAPPEAREALDKTLARIMAVGRVHEQLYQAGGEIGQFDAGMYAERLARELVESMGRDDIELETEVEPTLLDMRQAAPLALILNELITNALKYGCQPDKPGKILVKFGTIGEDYRLSVSDNGVGLPEGFSTRTTKSLGMRAIDALARQLQGRLVVEQQEVGAGFAVIFPRSTT